MKTFSWTEVSGAGYICLECAALGENSMLKRTVKLLEGNLVSVNFECPTCQWSDRGVVNLGAEETPARARESHSPQPIPSNGKPSAIASPTTEELAKFSKPKKERVSPLEVQKPVEPIDQQDLMELLKEKIPELAEIEYEGKKFPVKRSLTNKSVPNVGVGTDGSLATSAPGVLVQIYLNMGYGRSEKLSEELVLCASGEPNVEELMDALARQAANEIRGTADQVHYVRQPAPKTGRFVTHINEQPESGVATRSGESGIGLTSKNITKEWIDKLGPEAGVSGDLGAVRATKPNWKPIVRPQ